MIVLDEWNLADEEEVKPINELANQVDEGSVEVAPGPETETRTTLPDLSLVLSSADEDFKVPLLNSFLNTVSRKKLFPSICLVTNLYFVIFTCMFHFRF